MQDQFKIEAIANGWVRMIWARDNELREIIEAPTQARATNMMVYAGMSKDAVQVEDLNLV